MPTPVALTPPPPVILVSLVQGTDGYRVQLLETHARAPQLTHSHVTRGAANAEFQRWAARAARADRAQDVERVPDSLTAELLALHPELRGPPLP